MTPYAVNVGPLPGESESLYRVSEWASIEWDTFGATPQYQWDRNAKRVAYVGAVICSNESEAHDHWQKEHAALNPMSGIDEAEQPRKVWLGTLQDILEGKFVAPIHRVKPSEFSLYNGIFGDAVSMAWVPK